MDFNKNLVLACIYMYYENALMTNKHTLSNIFKHIEIVMCIIRHRFINKSGTKQVLLHLVKENYLTRINTNKYKADLSMIDEEIKKYKNIYIIKDIFNIKEDVYMRTAVFYNLPTTLFSKHIPKFQAPINRTQLFQKFTKKINLIKIFLNNITKIHNTNFDTIHATYVQKTENYRQDLQNLLATINTSKNYNK
ncbi:uncharacterized protein LOC111039826 [Myzus persicae]|uniref:uncharacterized protein LOC111039826 n=1 Tax=Myzus persicae TaxID=13164 RepID=UPI000B932A95|nr:uncharacterized protein LOC111039826 [Myzus persicae]